MKRATSLQVLFKFILRPPFLLLSMIVPPGSCMHATETAPASTVRYRHFPRFYRENLSRSTDSPRMKRRKGYLTIPLCNYVILYKYCNIRKISKMQLRAPFYLRVSIYFSATLCTPLAYRNTTAIGGCCIPIYVLDCVTPPLDDGKMRAVGRSFMVTARGHHRYPAVNPSIYAPHTFVQPSLYPPYALYPRGENLKICYERARGR